MLPNIWRWWLSCTNGSRSHGRSRRGRFTQRGAHVAVRPRLESLEHRINPATRYVDDSWVGTMAGTQPANDPVGGLVFGTTAFADIQSAINQAAAGDTVVVFGGNYPAAVNVNKALAGIQVATNATTPAQTLVSVNGAVTLTNDS